MHFSGTSCTYYILQYVCVRRGKKKSFQFLFNCSTGEVAFALLAGELHKGTRKQIPELKLTQQKQAQEHPVLGGFFFSSVRFEN